MKKLLAVLFIAALIAGCGGAAEAHEYAAKDHSHYSDSDDVELGLGMDLILHEGEDGDLLNQLTAEYKYDFNNDDSSSFYLVGKIKLADIVSKIKGLKGHSFFNGSMNEFCIHCQLIIIFEAYQRLERFPAEKHGGVVNRHKLWDMF